MGICRNIKKLMIIGALVSAGVIAEYNFGVYDKTISYIKAISCQIEEAQRFAEEKGLLSKLNE